MKTKSKCFRQKAVWSGFGGSAFLFSIPVKNSFCSRQTPVIFCPCPGPSNRLDTRGSPSPYPSLFVGRGIAHPLAGSGLVHRAQKSEKSAEDIRFNGIYFLIDNMKYTNYLYALKVVAKQREYV